MNYDIMNYYIIEGFSDTNNETKWLMVSIDDIKGLSKFNEIKNKVNVLNKRKNKYKIIFVLFEIYYLKKKFIKNLNEFKLVINEGNRYFEENRNDYDDFIDNI